MSNDKIKHDIAEIIETCIEEKTIQIGDGSGWITFVIPGDDVQKMFDSIMEALNKP